MRGTCYYCGKKDDGLIYLGEPPTEPEAAKLQMLLIHVQGKGCQAPYKPTWSDHLCGTKYYDLPFIVLGVIVITAGKLFLYPTFERFGLDEAKIIFSAFWILLPLGGWFVGYPIIISPVILAFFAWLMM